uniref:Putative secreted protein n=1 Tax=Ixodes ricinus TaxID=34613 RepID=A0A6B0UFL8_IXORI
MTMLLLTFCVYICLPDADEVCSSATPKAKTVNRVQARSWQCAPSGSFPLQETVARSQRNVAKGTKTTSSNSYMHRSYAQQKYFFST